VASSDRVRTVRFAGPSGEGKELPYVRCPGCVLDTYSAAGHSTIDECPRCGAPLDGGVRWERIEGPQVRRRRIALAGLDPDVAASAADVPAVSPAAPEPAD
jgi:hypothetical protein